MKSILISIADQKLVLSSNGKKEQDFSISTAKLGIGNEPGSFKTPIGRFVIAEKIGEKAPLYSVFESREIVGTWPDDLPPSLSQEDDLVLSRILWLSGIDADNKSTFSRYIYIHGTNHPELLGSPASCGCIRMTNHDVVKLFDQVFVGTPVTIIP